MKRILSLAFVLLLSACNDGELATTTTEEPTPEPTPEPTGTPPLPEQADVAVTLAWDGIGDDWELHLVKPGGRINDPLTDCTWTTCIYSSPDWGVTGDAYDDPHKDIDDVDTFGPERIWLAEPEAGTFTVLVEHWGSEGSPDSDGTIEILVGTQTTTVAMSNLPYMHVWTAATIEFPSGNVTTGQAVYDCSASWSAGCTAQLP